MTSQSFLWTVDGPPTWDGDRIVQHLAPMCPDHPSIARADCACPYPEEKA